MSHYTLTLLKGASKKHLAVEANDIHHAQAQAVDIHRSLGGVAFKLELGESEPTNLSRLFRRLAYNDFNYEDCINWGDSTNMGNPCLYVHKKRLYVRKVITCYLDIPTDDCCVRTVCNNPLCVNPYHFDYRSTAAAKLTTGDERLLAAYRSQGTSISQCAEAFKVNRSTIYRKLRHESVPSGDESHRLIHGNGRGPSKCSC